MQKRKVSKSARCVFCYSLHVHLFVALWYRDWFDLALMLEAIYELIQSELFINHITSAIRLLLGKNSIIDHRYNTFINPLDPLGPN